MNILANEFNFYAVDRPEQKNINKPDQQALEVAATEEPPKPKRKKFLGLF